MEQVTRVAYILRMWRIYSYSIVYHTHTHTSICAYVRFSPEFFFGKGQLSLNGPAPYVVGRRGAARRAPPAGKKILYFTRINA